MGIVMELDKRGGGRVERLNSDVRVVFKCCTHLLYTKGDAWVPRGTFQLVRYVYNDNIKLRSEFVYI